MDYLHPEADDAGIGELSALALAHLGDGVYELMVRTWCVLHRKLTNRSLHSAVVRYVAAPAQAAAARRIEPLLTDEERSVFRRGRNAHTAAVPPKATRGEYHAATALETLFGYLYLRGRTDRLGALFAVAMEEEPDIPADGPAGLPE